MKMKHKIFLLVLIILSATSLFVYSDDAETVISLYIDNALINTEYPVLKIDNSIVVPMSSLFNSLGAQIYDNNIASLASYRLNTYVKVDLDRETYKINGKTYVYSKKPLIKDKIVYVPVELLIKAFDFNVVENDDEDSIYLSSNNLVQYRNYDGIPYRQIASDDYGIRYSVPLYWENIGENMYGYDTSYGENSMFFTTRDLNGNNTISNIIDTYKGNLLLEYKDNVVIGNSTQRVFNYLTSNVLYITLDVNEKIVKKIIHFIPIDGKVFIITFTYTDGISESYVNRIFDIIMNSFYIDKISVDTTIEHYIEYSPAINLGFYLSDDIYSNMTLEKYFILNGNLNTKVDVESLTITVSRDNEQLQFYVPVENNSFHYKVYTPFGLGKHNIKIEITKPDSDSNTLSSLLMQFSVVNLSKDEIRYKIPTKNVQSEDEYLQSMSKLLSYNYHTSYSKAKNIYDYIVENVEVLEVNEENYSAKEVYLELKGTKKEISLYLTTLLRAQDIPARIIEGKSEYASHYWTEAFLNGDWIIIDPVGDDVVYENPETFPTDILERNFNASSTKYDLRYPEQTILEY